MGSSASKCTKDQMEKECQNICKTLSKPVMPRSVAEWRLYNDTNKFVIMKFSGKEGLVDIDNTVYYKLWKVRDVEEKEHIDLEKIFNYAPGNSMTETENIISEERVDVPLSEELTPDEETALDRSKLTIPVDKIDTTFVGSNTVLDPKLFPQQQGGSLSRSQIYTDNLKKIYDTFKPFLVLEPGITYSFTKIFNFYPFVMATIDKDTTTTIELDSNSVTCVGAIYPSENTVTVSNIQSNDILDSFKNAICNEFKEI